MCLEQLWSNKKYEWIHSISTDIYFTHVMFYPFIWDKIIQNQVNDKQRLSCDSRFKLMGETGSDSEQGKNQTLETHDASDEHTHTHLTASVI